MIQKIKKLFIGISLGAGIEFIFAGLSLLVEINGDSHHLLQNMI